MARSDRVGRNNGRPRNPSIYPSQGFPSFSRYNKPAILNDFLEFYCARTMCLSAQYASAEWSPTRIAAGRSSPFGKFWEALLGLTTGGSGFPYIRRNEEARVHGLIRERRAGWKFCCVSADPTWLQPIPHAT